MVTASETAADCWARQIAEWAIPDEILDTTPHCPFGFVPEVFAAVEPGTFEPSLSNRRAAEALDYFSTVLDVGCGGGAAAFAVAPPATTVIGIDRQTDMLELFVSTASERGIAAQVHLGSWPEIADDVHVADVVVCHNVLYNVSDITGFVVALDTHARRRVVVEITPRHPQDCRRKLWQHFWNLERPYEPTAATAARAIAEAGFNPVVEKSQLPASPFEPRHTKLDAARWCRQMCLPPEREPEVAALMADITFPQERVTIWWDKH